MSAHLQGVPSLSHARLACVWSVGHIDYTHVLSRRDCKPYSWPLTLWNSFCYYQSTSPNSPKLPQHFPTPPVARVPNMDWNSPAVLSLVLEGPHFPAHFLSRHSLQGPVDCLSLSQPASHSVESSSARQHASKRESKSSPVVRWLVRSSFVHWYPPPLLLLSCRGRNNIEGCLFSWSLPGNTFGSFCR